jgi:peptide/nickel transport system permease protein
MPETIDQTLPSSGVASLAPPAPRANSPRRRDAGELVTWAALSVVAAVAVAALFPEQLAPFGPTHLHDAVLDAPGATHPFGTDQFGRDVLSLVIYGARQSILMGIAAVAVGATLGVSVGICAGYLGGKVDFLLMRAIDVWMAVPSILLAISVSTALGPSLGTTILAVSLASVPRYARVLRGQALSVRSRPFIQAARAAGASHAAIMRGHVLPQCVPTILVMATLGIGSSILVASGLSFLGLGVNDERPDWGYLLTQGRGYLTVAWWTVTFPGAAITALVVSVNLLGDALRKKLDPRVLRR